MKKSLLVLSLFSCSVLADNVAIPLQLTDQISSYVNFPEEEGSSDTTTVNSMQLIQEDYGDDLSDTQKIIWRAKAPYGGTYIVNPPQGEEVRLLLQYDFIGEQGVFDELMNNEAQVQFTGTPEDQNTPTFDCQANNRLNGNSIQLTCSASINSTFSFSGFTTVQTGMVTEFTGMQTFSPYVANAVNAYVDGEVTEQFFIYSGPQK